MKWGYLAITVLFILLFIGGPNNFSNRLYREAWGTGHVILFSVSILVLLQIPAFKKKTTGISFLYTTLFCIATGVATEVLQTTVGRSFEFKDLLNDLLGGWLGWTVAAALNKSIKKWTRISMLPAILLILFFSLNPVYRSAVNAINIARQFPVLSDFETSYELDRWNSKLATIHLGKKPVRNGTHAMRIELNTGIYPGISLESFNHKWTGYSKLQCSLYNTGSQPISINLKVYDRRHTDSYEFSDRFNRTLILKPGWNDISVSLDDIRIAPQDRMMDLSDITSFSLFLSHLDSPMTLHLDNLRLSH